MVCPMKFNITDNPKFFELFDLDTINSFVQCDKESCAWYCTYSNGEGEGECAIHSLVALSDGLESISEMINRK